MACAAQLDYIGHHGAPGDYLIQVALYDLGGFASMLLAQVTLCVLSVVCVYRMARTVLGDGRLPLLVAGVYGLLPQTLIFPHQLSAEAWFVPFVVFGFYWMTRWFATRAPRARLALRAVLGRRNPHAAHRSALRAPVRARRPARHRRGSARVSYALALVVPVFAWVAMVHAYTGKWSLGEGTSASVGNNLMLKARFISDNFPPEAKEQSATAIHCAGHEPGWPSDGSGVRALLRRLCGSLRFSSRARCSQFLSEVRASRD